MLLLTNTASSSEVQRFDGIWQTTVSCEALRDAPGYSYRFSSAVKYGVLHGEYGTAGGPGSLQIDGSISADGTGSIHAKGRTGSKEFQTGRDSPHAIGYEYNIETRFQGVSGTGVRIEGRPCIYHFEKSK
jgi:hypothetical protein